MAESEDDQRLAAIEERLAAVERRLGIARPEPPRPATPEPAAPPPPPTARRDVENIIGAQLLNRVGIAAVLVGAAFFLKYAFENQWIGPAARVGIGIIAGIGLLGWSERFHARGYRLFAHSLTVVGVGVLYLSVWAASQLYTLIANGGAFAAMTLVTAALVALALRHHSEFLAGLALTGGFLTPVLLSTGVNREVELFAYVALLDVAALVLVVLHPWMRALAVAFFGTVFLYTGWYSSFYSADQMRRTIGFATLFLLLFSVVPMLRRWEEERSGLASAVLLLLPFANAGAYFGAVAVILNGQPARLSWYAMALAAFFATIAGALRMRGSERHDLAAVHLALAVGFVTVAIPLRFDELWITVGWIAEAAALLAMAPRVSGLASRVFRLLGSTALGLAVVRLLLIDHFHPRRPLLNMRMLTYGMAIAVFVFIAWRARDALWRFAVFAANALALIALTAEVRMALKASGPAARDFGWSALWMLYGAALMAVGFRRGIAYFRWLALGLIGITIAKVFLYDLSALERAYRIIAFIALGVLLLGISFAYAKKSQQSS